MLVQTLVPLALGLLLLGWYIHIQINAAKPDPVVLKRAVLYEVPAELESKFTAKEMHIFRMVFSSMDKGDDSSGHIDKAELVAMIMELSPEITLEDAEREADVMMKEASTDGDLEISLSELLQAVSTARREGRTSGFSTLVDKVEAKVTKQAGGDVIYAILTLTFLVLISTSTLLFNFFKCHE